MAHGRLVTTGRSAEERTARTQAADARSVGGATRGVLAPARQHRAPSRSCSMIRTSRSTRACPTCHPRSSLPASGIWSAGLPAPEELRAELARLTPRGPADLAPGLRVVRRSAPAPAGRSLLPEELCRARGRDAHCVRPTSVGTGGTGRCCGPGDGEPERVLTSAPVGLRFRSSSRLVRPPVRSATRPGGVGARERRVGTTNALPFAGRVAVITGGGRGQGRSHAVRVRPARGRRRGLRSVRGPLVDRLLARPSEGSRGDRHAGRRARPTFMTSVADVRDLDAMIAFVDRVAEVARFGRHPGGERRGVRDGLDPDDGCPAVERDDRHQPDRRVQLDPCRGTPHAAPELGPDHRDLLDAGPIRVSGGVGVRDLQVGSDRAVQVGRLRARPLRDHGQRGRAGEHLDPDDPQRHPLPVDAARSRASGDGRRGAAGWPRSTSSRFPGSSPRRSLRRWSSRRRQRVTSPAR